MNENKKWDDSNDAMLDIIEGIEDSKEPQIPIKCPICNRGTIWTWCSKCKSCSHASRVNLPKWWENADFIDISELTAHPVFLEPKAAMADRHLSQLLEICN